MKWSDLYLKTIFFLNSYTEWGGGEKWTFQVAEELNKDNEYRVIVGSMKTSKLYQKAVKTGIETRVVAVKSSLTVFNLYKLFSFVKYLQKEKIDVLFLNLSEDLKFGAIAAKLAGVKKIIYRRGSAIPIKNRFYTRFLLDFCVTDIIANSISTKETILQNTKEWLDESKIQIIYNGIKMDEVRNQLSNSKSRNIRDDFNIDNNTFLIANVGRLTKQKGHVFLLEAISLLKDKIQKFKVLLVGEGELEEQIKTKISELRLDDYIILTGFRTDVFYIMNEVDILLHTALWEGFGYVVAEAMAVGTPVVSTDVSNISEILIDVKNGYLARSEDPDDIARKVEKLYNRKDLEIIKKNCKNRIKENFTFKQMIISLKMLL